MRAAYPGSELGVVTMKLDAFGVKFTTSIPEERSVTPMIAVATLAEGAGAPWILDAAPR
jgi:hypothetical protein